VLCRKSKRISCTMDMRAFTQLYMHASNSMHLCLTFSVLTFSALFRQRKKRERDQEEDPGKTTRLTLSLKKNVIPSVCTLLNELVLVSPVHLLCQPFAVSHTGSSIEHLLLSCCL